MRFTRGGLLAILAGAAVGWWIASHEYALDGFQDLAILPSVEEPSFPLVLNEPVRRAVDRYSTSQAPTIRISLKRAGRWEGMIRSTLREHGVPEELVYLPLIESSFDPLARSPAQAVGLWQFIPETGRRYGLRIDRYVDERRDPERSTEAAARYLTDMHDRFGSWYLAAAGYNSGHNRVGRIMRDVTGSEHGADGDFWRIRHRLPRETQNYVPRLIAATIVASDPELYGIDAVERWSPLAYETVAVPPGTPLFMVARATGASEAEIRALNPALVRGVSPPEAPYHIRIPEGRRAALLAELASAPTPPETGVRHVVRRGDSLSEIARRFGTTVGSIEEANDLRPGRPIRPGQRLRIPR